MEMLFTGIVVLCMLIALIRELARPDIIFVTALAALLAVNIITPEEALRGFSNQGMLTVALLFIVVRTIQKTGMFSQVTTILGKNSNPIVALIRIIIPASILSAFLNNTPIVVAFTPMIRKWCEQHNLSPSKYLIPLSYATILGGTVTLIGTSTNLVVHGMLISEGLEGFSFFQLGVVGIPILIIGSIYLIFIGYHLLPDRKMLTETAIEQSREYLAELRVGSDCPLIGKSIEDAGLRNLKGLFLIEIIRVDERLTPVASYATIHAEDRLIFTGLISTIAELQNIKGLSIETGGNLTLDSLRNDNTQLIEVVVAHDSTLLNRKIKHSNFRSRYDAAVVAVHRKNERIHSKIGDITLQTGDTLLLLTGKDFTKRRDLYDDFYIVTPVNEPEFQTISGKSWVAIGFFTIMLIMVILQVLSMFKAALFTVIFYLITKMITPEEAKKAVHFNLLLIIACAFGIGAAMTKTGLASWIALNLLALGEPLGILGVLFLLYLVTTIFTEVITNNAAAVLVLPIGLSVASILGIDYMAVAMIVALAASASFITPIGYQTNLIVYGPGNYRFTDYIKVGLPLNIITMITTVLIVYTIFI